MSKKTTTGPDAASVFQEWSVKVNNEGGKISFECWKLVHPKRKISSDEARTLNSGIQDGDNRFANIYLCPVNEPELGKIITPDEIIYEPKV